MNIDLKKILVVLAIIGISTMAQAQDIPARECYGRLNNGTTLTLKTDHGQISNGSGISIYDNIGRMGYYRISEIYAPSFSVVAYGVGYRSGYSFGSLRLVEYTGFNVPLRLQYFIQDKKVEIILTCR